MAANDPRVRKTVAAAGGTARMAQGDPAELLATRRSAAAAVNSPGALARRLVKAWPDMPAEARVEVLSILTAGLPLRRAPRRSS